MPHRLDKVRSTAVLFQPLEETAQPGASDLNVGQLDALLLLELVANLRTLAALAVILLICVLVVGWSRA